MPPAPTRMPDYLVVEELRNLVAGAPRVRSSSALTASASNALAATASGSDIGILAPDLMQTLRDECSAAGVFRGMVAEGDVTAGMLPAAPLAPRTPAGQCNRR